jgi:cellulose biosynthesis protein BcsQ
VIDTPASQGILTTAALAAADFCLTPCSTDDAAFQQLPAFAATIEVIKRRINPRLVWLPVVPTMFDQRQVMDRAVLDAMREQYRVFDQVVPRRVAIREQMAAGQQCTVPELESLASQIIKEIRRHEEEVRGAPPRKR